MKNRNALVIAIWIVIGLALAYVNNARAMEFEVLQFTDTGEDYIVAYGPIEADDDASFEQFC